MELERLSQETIRRPRVGQLGWCLQEGGHSSKLMLAAVTPKAISVRGLHKSYGDLEAVRGIDLEVNSGEVFALLGPNGAGKTTTVEILEGHRDRTSGDVDVLGHDPRAQEKAYKERIGIVLQETGVDRFLTVSEVIDQYRGYYPHPRPVDEVMEVVGLTEKRDTLVRKLSGGLQRRLDVGVGLAGDPELLFLDEPTTGFDPQARRNAWVMVKNLQALGKTVFLTTHYMDEAQHLADRVAIISGGVIVAEGAPQDLIRDNEVDTVIRFASPPGATALPASLSATEVEGRMVIHSDEPVRALNELTSWALQERVELLDLAVERPSFEDIYLKLVGDSPKEASS